MRVVGGGEQRHGEALLARGDALVLLEGGSSRGHEDDEVEAKVVEGLLGGHEVAVVDGVERAAHDAEAIRAVGVHPEGREVVLPQGVDVHAYLTCPSPRTTYLVVVSSAAPMGPRAWSFCVEMPISAPRPKTPPSVKRVEALA